MNDDVIPFEEMAALAGSMPSHITTRVYATGLYGHSERGGLMSLLSLLPSAVREGRTMLAMLGDLARYSGLR